MGNVSRSLSSIGKGAKGETWVSPTIVKEYSLGGSLWTCPRCGEVIKSDKPGIARFTPSYCPNCGVAFPFGSKGPTPRIPISKYKREG